ncbi:serine/threonine-protein kinase [Pedococcus sp. NPDC057267]|uniref:serine/threonine-protein kinase n=1 Tax=Pedococcus sp. NPDC057267 TaxID=3346077 RepID=UPI0036435509
MRTRESELVDDRYVPGDVIGRGGMADVYRAEDRVLQRPVAMKVMREVATDPRELARFDAEVRTLAHLSHPGLVPVWDAGTWDDRPYLVMELIEGPTLADCCRGVALDPTRLAAIGAELASAVAYVHASGVVHRDIKPGNVLLDANDRVRLTDFGIAKLLSDTSRHTATGTTIGTAAYLAPEQVRGERVDAAADVYSLGLVLLEGLTGQRAYQGSATEAALARLNTPPHVPAALPPAWRRLLVQMTSLEPDLRPTADQAAAALSDVAAGEDPCTATAVIRSQASPTQVLTEPRPRGLVHAESSGKPRPRGDLAPLLRTRPGVAALAGLLVVVVATAVLLVGKSGGPPSDGQSPVPSGVPSRLQEPLRDLHNAVEGRQ